MINITCENLPQTTQNISKSGILYISEKCEVNSINFYIKLQININENINLPIKLDIKNPLDKTTMDNISDDENYDDDDDEYDFQDNATSLKKNIDEQIIETENADDTQVTNLKTKMRSISILLFIIIFIGLIYVLNKKFFIFERMRVILTYIFVRIFE